jgi:hypothetical protein
MNIAIRTCPAVHAPVVRPFAARRIRSATGRLAGRLQGVEVNVTRESPRDGGRFVCRIQGTLADGGTVVVKRDEKDARAAVAGSVERFRSSLVRTLGRLDRSGP